MASLNSNLRKVTCNHVLAISVVIPLYNKEHRVGDCLRSVMRQTVSPYEIIVIDDGSSDNSARLASEVLTEYKGSWRLISQENSGVSVARNAGVEASSTELVAFLDADDEWTPDFIARMTFLARDYPNASLYCSTHDVVDESRGRRSVRPDLPLNFRGYVPDFFRASLRGGIANSSKVVVRKSVLRRFGGFPAKVKAGEDLYVWMVIASGYLVAFEDFVGAVVVSNPEEGRLQRANESPYPLVYYAKGLRHQTLSTSARKYLWRIFHVHFFGALLNGNQEVAARNLSFARVIFPRKTIIYQTFLHAPDWLFRAASRLLKR